MTSFALERPGAGNALSVTRRDAAGMGNRVDSARRILWTGSAQCRALASVLGDGAVFQADGDLATACIRARASLLIARSLTSFDLCSIAVPHGFSPTTTRSVVAAVGSGPHSQLAAVLTQRLSSELGIPARIVFGHRDAEDLAQAQDALAALALRVPGLDVETVHVADPATMVSALPAGALLVVGAPGGSWFQRQFFGPGARIEARATNGTIVVRHTPTRVYQIMQPPAAFGPNMRVADAALLSGERHAIVAQHGELLGLVPLSTLTRARPTLELIDVMEGAVWLTADEGVEQATDLINLYDGNPVPVVDNHARLVGVVSTAELARRPSI